MVVSGGGTTDRKSKVRQDLEVGVYVQAKNGGYVPKIPALEG